MFRNGPALIEEVKKKRSLWHSAYKQTASDKNLRAKQWSEVAQSLFSEWYLLSAIDQKDIIIDLKRKWKSIRDYNRKGTKNSTGKKYIYSHLLEFLDEELAADNIPCSITTNEMDISSITVDQPSVFKPQESEIGNHHESIPSGSEDLSNQDFKTVEPTFATCEITALTAKLPPMLPSSKRSFQEDSKARDEESIQRGNNYDELDDDADKYFLLSLLPEMRNLTGLQKIDFKINALRELKSAKYGRQYFVIKEEPKP